MFAIVLIVVSACRFTSSRRRWCVLWHSLTLPVGQTFGLSNWPLHWPGPKSLEQFMRKATTECFQSPVPSHPRTAIPQGTVLQAAVIQLTRPTHTRSDFKAWNAPRKMSSQLQPHLIHKFPVYLVYLNMRESARKDNVYLLITCKAHDSSLDASLPHCVYTHKHIDRITSLYLYTKRLWNYIFFVLCLCYVWFELQSAN